MATSSKVAIVGSGIAGALIALELAQRGHKVHVFEKGPEYPFPHTPQFDQSVTNFDNLNEYILPRDLKAHTSTGDYKNNLEAERYMNVGGSATRWDGITPRMTAQDFKTKTLFGYGLDWPIDYDVLEPYYCRAESLMGISGTDADNPFASPRSKPHPLPQFDLSHDDVVLQEMLSKKGLALHTTPQARTRLEYDGRPGCQNFGACATCPIGVRYSPNHHLNKALATGNCTLVTNASVRRVVVDGKRSTGLVYRLNDDKEDQEHHCDVVIAAAGALETIRLFFLSKNEAHPNGVGNATGQLGQNFAYHHMWPTYVRLKFPLRIGGFGGYTGQSHQFVNAPTRGQHGSIKIEFTSRAPRFQREVEKPWVSPEELFDRLHDHLYMRSIRMHAESAPSPDKHVRLSTRKDRFGDALAHVHYKSNDFDVRTYEFAQSLFRQFAEALEGELAYMPSLNGFNSGAHHMGGCSMGLTPEDSVTDSHGAVHGLENLYVAGSSIFRFSPGAMNPTLTIAALALRTSDRLAETLV